MGMFDDLIPQAAKPGPGMFDDLIPKGGPATITDPTQVTMATLGGVAHDAPASVAQSVGAGDMPFTDPDVAAANDEITKGLPVAGALVPQSDRMTALEKNNPGAVSALNTMGSAIGTIPLMAAAPEAFGVGAGQSTAARLGLGAVSNGGIAAADTAARGGDLGDIATNAGESALMGSGMNAFGGSVLPFAGEAALNLMKRGIPLTSGQIMGPIGNGLEKVSQNLPLSGLVAKSARNAADEGLNRAVANEALAPIGQKLGDDTAVGPDALKEVGDKIDAAYYKAIPGLRGKWNDGLMDGKRVPGISGQIAGIQSSLPSSVQPQYEDAINRLVIRRLDKDGNLMGPNIQGLDGDLRNEFQDRIANSGNTDDRLLGQALRDTSDAIRDNLKRYSYGSALDKLDAADRAYSMKKVMENAQQKAKANGGVFNADHLMDAVNHNDAGLDSGAVPGGSYGMQDLAATAKKVMGGNDDPTKDARSAALKLYDLVGGGLELHFAPSVLAGNAAHAAAYSPWGQSAFRALASGAPGTRQAFASAIRKAGPALAAAMSPKDYASLMAQFPSDGQ